VSKVLEQTQSEARTADVVKDVTDNEVDSLRSVFHALKVEPCRIRLVSTTPMIRGKNKYTYICYLFILFLVIRVAQKMGPLAATLQVKMCHYNNNNNNNNNDSELLYSVFVERLISAERNCSVRSKQNKNR